MVDSEALRSRRYRAHSRGDHQWCRDDCAGKREAAAHRMAAESIHRRLSGREGLYAAADLIDRDAILVRLAASSGIELESLARESIDVGVSARRSEES